MQRNFESFYQPYVSDSEDSASITSADTSDSEESMKQSQIGSLKFLTQVGGINLNPPKKQVDLRIQPRTRGPQRGVEYSLFDLSGEYDKSLPFTGTTFDMVNGTYTSILMINSRDRDSQVYPQPTFFTIRLPRTYRNVASFQITQMKLLSSFFYFRPDKENTTLQVLEQGRTIVENGQTVDNVITVTIRTGTYNIDSLLAELQTQLNKTPLFFYYPNGFSDFIVQFTAAGDLSVNFNQPGDTYFNSLNDTFISNPTITQITTQYFATRYAGLSIYTLNQVKVAYYYPVIYEMLLDPDFENALDLTLSPTGPQLLPGETIRSRILYTFQGLNDGVILEVIDNNLAVGAPNGNTGSILDYYRTQHTFIYSLVNEYNCTYETNNNRIVISTTRLNTSLFNLLNNQAAIALADTLNQYGLTLAQYSNLLLSNTLYTSVFTGMYNQLQSNFATYFAVNFGTYSPTFFTNVSNAPFVQNGIGAVGVATGYSLAILQSGQEPISSSAQNLQNSPGYWPQIVAPPNNAKNTNDGSNNVLFIGAGMGTRQQDLCSNFLNIPYNTIAGTLLTTTQFIDNSGSIYISPTFGAGDCVTPIYNSKYTVFRFRSYVRQTLQVETLPLPYYYRYPDANQVYFSNTKTYPGIVEHFNQAYTYIDSPYLTRTDISGIPIVFAQNYSNAFSNSESFNFTVASNIRYYSFQMPQPISRYDEATTLTDSSGYKYPVRLNFTSVSPLGLPTPYASQFDFYLYHDQGAFYADISQNRNESPYNYKYTVESTIDVSNSFIDFNAIAGNTYYVISRSKEVSFQNTRIRPFVYFPSGWSTPIVRYFYNKFIDVFDSNPTVSYPATTDASYNILYAVYYDPDYIRLPTSSNIMGLDPSSESFNQFLPVFEPPIGYDVSGVSTDLTDYRGYSSNVRGFFPNNTFSMDPANRFSFQFLSPYQTANQTYFYTGSSNALLAPISNAPYTARTVDYRQYKIVHWYDTNYVAPQQGQRGIPNNGDYVALSRVFDASYGALQFYTYEVSGNNLSTENLLSATGGLSLGAGVASIGFLPNEGTWDIDGFVIKTAYMERPLLSQSFTDPNKNIKYLGVYPNNQIQNYITSDISLNNAIVVLNYQSSIVYSPTFQQINQGFDNVGGTYHTFARDPNFTKTTRFNLVGYTPSETYNFDSNNFYSLVAFDGSGSITPFYTPMGSYIPYPKVSEPAAVLSYNDSNGFYRIPNSNILYSNNINCNIGFYLPSNIAYAAYANLSNYFPQDYNDSNISALPFFQSRYQQSIPIKTSLITSLSNTNIIDYSNALNYYPTQSTPMTTLLPEAYGSWCNANPILYMTKGPFFFWVDNPDLLQARLYITSNLNQAATQSNVSFRGTKLVGGPVLLQSITKTGDYAPSTLGGNPSPNSNVVVAMTTNNTGPTDRSGIFALMASYYPSVTSNIPPVGAIPGATSYGFDFSVYQLNFDPDTSNITGFARTFLNNSGTFDFQVQRKFQGEAQESALPNSPIYTGNFSYTKFNYRTGYGSNYPGPEGMLMFQFAQQYDHDVNNIPTTSFNGATKSIFGVVEIQTISPFLPSTQPRICVNVGVKAGTAGYNNFEPAGQGFSNTYLNVLAAFSDRNGVNPAPLAGTTASTCQYYWDNPRRQYNTNPPFAPGSPENYLPIFDWTTTDNGLLYVARGNFEPAGRVGPSGAGSLVTSLERIYTSQGFPAASNTPILMNAGFVLNNLTSQSVGTTNQVSTDLCGNIYLQQQVLPGLTFRTDLSGQLPLGLINQGWNLNTFGRYFQILGYRQQYDVYQPLVNPIPLVATLTDSESYLRATVYDTVATTPGQTMIAQSLCTTSYKSNSNLQPIFLQAANNQGFYYNSANTYVGNGITPLNQADISGFIDILFYNSNVNPQFLFSLRGIPVAGTTAQKQAAASNSIIQQCNFDAFAYNNFSSQYPYQFGNQAFINDQLIFAINYASPITNIFVGPSAPPLLPPYDITGTFPFNILPLNTSNFGITGQSTSNPYAPVQGNSAFGVDTLPPTLINNWQVFYPTCKFIMKKVNAEFTPITNTIDLIGSNNQPPDTFEHTAMFYYDNYTDLSNDIFNKFGMERKARFKNFDISSGYGFHSYIYNIQLDAFKGNSIDISANNNYKYLAVRAYSPCEKFNCLTRFYLPERYDFGFISLKDLSNETQTVLVDLSGSALVNPVYQTVLNAFNNSFKGSFTFGSNAVAGFNGSNYTFTGFPQFLNTYIQVYNTGNSNAQLLAAITSNVQQKVANYIQTYLSAILPSYILTRERFTDPLLFSFLFKSGLSDTRRDLEYEWGLGWNLGYPKIDTPFDTIQRATSFFKILDDYIYLKLNQEFWMNRLDSSGPENLSITHEPTGQTNQFAAKLLLANFGAYAQTMVQNPVTFNPVLTAIDKLSFQWVDIAGVQIDNLDCEWNAAVQITEQVTQATTTSTIPKAQAAKK